MKTRTRTQRVSSSDMEVKFRRSDGVPVAVLRILLMTSSFLNFCADVGMCSESRISFSFFVYAPFWLSTHVALRLRTFHMHCIWHIHSFFFLYELILTFIVIKSCESLFSFSDSIMSLKII